MAFKMMGKSPMMKKLIGKQENLPAELKAKIEAAPESPAKMKKAPAKMAKDPAMKMKKAPMRKDKVTYSEAYNRMTPTKSGGRYDEKNKKNYNSEAEFTAAAKAYNNTPKKVETKKVTKVEVKTAKPDVKKVKVNEKVMEGKKTLGDTKLGNVKVGKGKNAKRLADTKVGQAFSKARAKAAASRAKRKAIFDAAKAERKAKRDAKNNKK